MNKKRYYIERVAAIITAVILLQTLFFKFTGHPDSVYIFSSIGIEPYGRIGLGIVELIVAGLLLFFKTSLWGGILGTGIAMGAIISHLFILGIVVNNDGGMLFSLAIISFLCSAVVVFLKKEQLLLTLNKR